MDLDPRTENQLRLLSDGRNRAICETIEEAGEPIQVSELADRLVTRELTFVSSQTYDDEFDRACFELHHDRLPKLDELDLLSYDPETNVARPRSSDAGWFAKTDFDELRSYLENLGETDAGDVGIVEGMDSVVRYGRKLADEAETELFALYVTTDLIEDECLEHGEGALRRDVSVVIGSNNGTVRELTRENLPEATVWEPQLDLLNRPTYPRVGRLVLVDRRSVMLSVLEEPPSAGDPPQETAFVGDGEENPVVVLVRELLGPRLDHLDFQSDDFRSELYT